MVSLTLTSFISSCLSFVGFGSGRNPCKKPGRLFFCIEDQNEKPSLSKNYFSPGGILSFARSCMDSTVSQSTIPERSVSICISASNILFSPLYRSTVDSNKPHEYTLHVVILSNFPSRVQGGLFFSKTIIIIVLQRRRGDRTRTVP